MNTHSRIKFLIPKKKEVVEIKKDCSTTIRDQMEIHEALDKQYDDKIKDHVHKALHKRREDIKKKVQAFLMILLLAHVLVIIEMLMILKVWGMFR